MTESSPSPAGSGRPFDAQEFARQTVHTIEMGDAYASVLERRVIRIEEIIAARWPRSWLLRRRLAREIRASVATWDPEYIPRENFYSRRFEAAAQEAHDILNRQERAAAAGWPEPGGSQAARAVQDSPETGSGEPGEGFLP